jgi:PhnB protein
MKVKSAPDGYHTITPYLKLRDCGRLIEFLKQAFGGVERGRLLKPDGTPLHADVVVGDSVLMLHEAPPEWPRYKPATLFLRVEDADATFKQAIAAGAKAVFGPANMYYGARVACVTDFADNDWWIESPLEQLTLEEIQKRATEFLKSKEALTKTAGP